MKVEKTKEVLNIIKNEPLSILIIFSLLFLPVIFLEWIHFFPASLNTWVVVLIILVWIIAFIRLRRELLLYRRSVILTNYLKKEKRHSLDHLTKEWAGKNEFTVEVLQELVRTYPDVFKYTKVKSRGKNKDGIGFVN